MTPFITAMVNALTDINRSNTTHNLVLELSVLGLVAIVMYSIVQVLKNRAEYRLKNKMINDGIADEQVLALQHGHANEQKHARIKWLVILGGVIALTIMYYTPPLELYSPAILALVVYFSLGGYRLFLHKTR